MKIYNVTKLIHPQMIVYKNRESKKVVITEDANFDNSNVFESRISFNVHTGTHMDFPRHVIKDGPTSKAFDLTTFLCDVKVFDLTNLDDVIALKDIKDLTINKDDVVFFKTKNSYDETFNFDFIYLNYDAAKYLSEKEVKAVGIDSLGIERNQEDHPTHNILLENNIYIIEGLDLKNIEENVYELIALPLYIDNVDGLPLTVLLKDKNNIGGKNDKE